MIRCREEMKNCMQKYFDNNKNDLIYICWCCNNITVDLFTNKDCHSKKWCRGNMCICISCEETYDLRLHDICSVCEHYKMICYLLPFVNDLNEIVLLYL